MHSHEHHHEYVRDGSTSSKSKLRGVSLINISGFVVELLGGLLFGSMTLLSDSIHMLFDASAYLTAFGASYVADNYQPDEH